MADLDEEHLRGAHLDETYLREAYERIIRSRIRLLTSHGFYGMLLMHLRPAIDPSCETAATEGEHIIFGPDFLDSLSDDELDFVMMHEVLHVALQHHLRNGDRDHLLFNIACDIVVNANIMHALRRKEPIVLAAHKEAIWQTPGGKSGHLYTAEEVYEELLRCHELRQTGGNGSGNVNGNARMAGLPGGFSDDHGRWPGVGDGLTDQTIWRQRVISAAEAAKKDDEGLGTGSLPIFAERMLRELREPQIDWRIILNDFVQEEIADYTFTPPDRRFDDLGFFLPDFSERNHTVKDLLFYVDTSGSIRDRELVAAFSEIAGAIEQFEGKLSGKLSFFDVKVSEPIPFETVADILKIRPRGGGGTNFHAVFAQLGKVITGGEVPSCAIILTDGKAIFPREPAAHGVPVLWIINNKTADPPWGKVARIT
jgi:predicted metal-dependent peptidase